MSVIHDDGRCEIHCDGGCGAVRPAFDRDDWDDMIADAKRAGWKIVSKNGAWQHRCPAWPNCGKQGALL